MTCKLFLSSAELFYFIFLDTCIAAVNNQNFTFSTSANAIKIYFVIDHFYWTSAQASASSYVWVAKILGITRTWLRQHIFQMAP